MDRWDTTRPASSSFFPVAALLRVRGCPDTKPNRKEKFNADIFRRLGDLGLLGVTVPEEYGGSGMDATAACIVHEELSAADPACCLSYLGECRTVSQGFGGSGVRVACAQQYRAPCSYMRCLKTCGRDTSSKSGLPRTLSGRIIPCCRMYRTTYFAMKLFSQQVQPTLCPVITWYVLHFRQHALLSGRPFVGGSRVKLCSLQRYVGMYQSEGLCTHTLFVCLDVSY